MALVVALGFSWRKRTPGTHLALRAFLVRRKE
jgi:hypothetical protein